MEYFWPPKAGNDPNAVTGGVNIGTGESIFAGEVANELQFKTLIAGTNITIDDNGDSLTLNASGGGGGGGDVSGPGAAVTDNAVVRWNGTGGTTIQNSLVTINDTGDVGAQSITLDLLTASRAVTTSVGKTLVSSATTSTELGYVSGVTSAIQTQINNKQASGNYITDLSGDVVATGPGAVAATIQPLA